MIAATTAARRAPTSTAPALASLAFSTSGWGSGETASHRNSKAVLSSSATHTIAMANTRAHHSRAETSVHQPRTQTTIVATAWIQALCWVRSATRIPRRA